jgi:hypothetical protein
MPHWPEQAVPMSPLTVITSEFITSTSVTMAVEVVALDIATLPVKAT